MCNCETSREIDISAKCSDLFHCFVVNNNNEHDGYVPKDIGIGDMDYIKFTYCLECGKISGKFPLPPAQIEIKEEEE